MEVDELAYARPHQRTRTFRPFRGDQHERPFVPQQRARLFLRNFKKREEFPLLEDILAGCAGGRWGNSSPGCEDNYGIEYRGCEGTEAE